MDQILDQPVAIKKQQGTPPGIEIRGLGLSYEQNVVFDNLELDILPKEFVAVLGSSGVGKSSLLRIIAGLEKPTHGTITASDEETLRGRIAYMGQQDLLLPWLTVKQNVMLGSRIRQEKPEQDWADFLIAEVGLEKNKNNLPSSLSGGMRQRAAIARTLYEKRPIVLMDEPFSALDAITRATMQELAVRLLEDRTILLITHDPYEACRLGSRLLVLSGNPARLGDPIIIPGLPPRSTENPDVVKAQAQLTRMFQENAA